jgi:deoxyribodipyrimidine photo-lyase
VADLLEGLARNAARALAAVARRGGRPVAPVGQGPGPTQPLGGATFGRTGIACFDQWTGELLETGYLHNHARVWFSSIWIFTLRLPWKLGADFFIRFLNDGDSASNTLSWRWVAGL